jgi:LacI family transcriptional regulator
VNNPRPVCAPRLRPGTIVESGYQSGGGMARNASTVTLSDVARHAGVSLATASRVLSRSAHNVTSELTDRVLAAAAELRYVPNAHAQALARASNSVVGMIVHDVSDPYFSEVARGVLRVAGDAGRLVMICNTYRDGDKELEYLALLRAHRVESLVIAGSGRDDEAFVSAMTDVLEGFTAHGGRVSFIGRHPVVGNGVRPDNRGGAYALASAFLERGHRQFAVITGPRYLTSTNDRLDGFRAALADAGVALDDDCIVESDFTRDGGAQAALHVAEDLPSTTAVFAMNDAMAIGALSTFKRLGVSVPDDVSLAGFNGDPATQDVTPTITTVRVPLADIGANAMALALEPSDAPPQVEVVGTEVVVGESLARPRRRKAMRARR